VPPHPPGHIVQYDWEEGEEEEGEEEEEEEVARGLQHLSVDEHPP